MDREIELHIEELVLHGFEGYDATRIKAEVEQRISSLLGEKELSTGLHVSISIGRVNAGTFTMQHHADAASIGSGIATSVYKSCIK